MSGVTVSPVQHSDSNSVLLGSRIRGAAACASRGSAWFAAMVCMLSISLLSACNRQGDRDLPLNGSNLAKDDIPQFVDVTPPRLYLNSVVVTQDGKALVAVGVKGDIVRSTDGGLTWKDVKHVTTAHLTKVVVEPKGALVAVGQDGVIVRSQDDGTTWRVAVSPTDNSLLDLIVDHQGALVAVGESATVLLSGDGGETWTEGEVPDAWQELTSIVAEPNGALIAIGKDKIIARSTDHGAKWTARTNVANRDFSSMLVEPLDGALVAVGVLGTIMRSSDGGETWGVSISDLDASLKHVMASPQGVLIAVGQNGAIMRSTNGGKSWAVAISETDADLDRVIVEPQGAMIAVGSEGTIMRSTDQGLTWQRAHHGDADGHLRDVIVEPAGALVAVGYGTILRSEDGGQTWRDVARDIAEDLWSVIAEPGGALIATGRAGFVFRSTNEGVTWNSVARQRSIPGTGTPAPIDHVAIGPTGILLAVGSEGGILRSADGGITWTAVGGDTDWNLSHVASNSKGIAIAVGRYGLVLRSTDAGANWEKVEGGKVQPENFNSLPAFINGQKPTLTFVTFTPTDALIAVGDDGYIFRSSDLGTTWKRVTSGTDESLTGVMIETHGSLIAVGGNHTILRSTDDGYSWTKAAVVGSGTDDRGLNPALVESKGSLVAVNYAGHIIRSTDKGATWAVVHRSETRRNLFDLIAAPTGSLMAVGTRGSILHSVDSGATWASLPSHTDSNLHSATVGPKGALVVVGDGVILRAEQTKRAPAIRRITQNYSASGEPLLRITVDDPSNLCPNGSCLSLEARSSADHKHLKEYRQIPKSAIWEEHSNIIGATIDPTLLSATPGQTIYGRVRISLPGYLKVYPSSEGYLPIENRPTPFYTHPGFLTFLVSITICGLMYATILLRPLWLLGMTTRQTILDLAPRAGIPGISDVIVSLFRTLLLPLLVRHPRVLNAWVRKHRDALRSGFENAVKSAAGRTAPYSTLPTDGPDGKRIDPSPDSLARFLKSDRCYLQIVGPGGAGKTRLAVEIGRWIFSDELTNHPASALLVDEEFNDLFVVVQEKLMTLLPDDMPPPAFIQALLSRGRLCVIVDRISERQQTTRDAMSRLYRRMSPKTLIGTTRSPLAVDGVVPTELWPRPLDPATLLSFLGDQLKNSKASDLFPGLRDQSALVQRLAQQITVDGRELRITPLLVRIFVAQAIEHGQKKGIGGIDDLPTNVPEAYFAYVEQLDATKRALEPDNIDGANLIRRAAAVIAFAELGEDFRPKAVPSSVIDLAIQADARLASSTFNFVRRMEGNGLLVRRQAGAEESIEYILDPLAECLAAFEHAKRCGSDTQLWLSLITRITARGRESRGFMLALRMNHAAYAQMLGFPPVCFPQADGDATP